MHFSLSPLETMETIKMKLISLGTVFKSDESTDFALEVEVGNCYTPKLENIPAQDIFLFDCSLIYLGAKS